MSFLTDREASHRAEQAVRETVEKTGVGNDWGDKSKGRETGQKQKAKETGRHATSLLDKPRKSHAGLSRMHPALLWSLERMKHVKSSMPWTALPSAETGRRASKIARTQKAGAESIPEARQA